MRYEAAAYAMYEFGARVHEKDVGSDDLADTADPDTDEIEVVVDVLSLLHGRACTVASEVLHLMRGGFEDGAAARQRTLHELAVTMLLIADDHTGDLAERYLDYAAVEAKADMTNYQLAAPALSRSPLPADEVTEIGKQFDEVISRRGKEFKKANEWARPLFPNSLQRITFAMLEEHCQLNHLRPFYRYANHWVHAGPRAALLNLRINEFGTSIGVGATTEIDVAEVGSAALISLYQATVAVFLRGLRVHGDPNDLMYIMAIDHLLKAANKALGRASRKP